MITSPNYPENYPNEVDCLWVVRPRTYPTPVAYKAESNPTLRVAFNGPISIENQTDFAYDYLKVGSLMFPHYSGRFRVNLNFWYVY